MTVFIAGRCGFIDSNLSSYFIEEGLDPGVFNNLHRSRAVVRSEPKVSAWGRVEQMLEGGNRP